MTEKKVRIRRFEEGIKRIRALFNRTGCEDDRPTSFCCKQYLTLPLLYLPVVSNMREVSKSSFIVLPQTGLLNLPFVIDECAALLH